MTLLPYRESVAKSACEELDAWKARLDYRGVLPRRWAGRLRRDLEAEAVAASTSMEGVVVTVDEVRRILAGDQPPEVEPADRDLVEGYQQAMNFVLRRADDPAFEWNRELIVGLHDRILAGKYDQGAGRLRTESPAFVVNRLTGEQVFLPPSGEEVEKLIDEACQRLREGPSHPAVLSAWAHVAIASIHPFRDGNGRVARVLASLAMYRGGFTRAEFTSLEEWWGHHRADYYAAFECLGERFRYDTDVSPFIEAHIEAQLKQVRSLDLRERVQREIWVVLEDIAEDANLHRRVGNALWDAFFGRDVTAGYYRGLADVSPATATNDLAGAVSAGLLLAEGQRRARRYLADVRLYEAVSGALGLDWAPAPGAAARDRIIANLSDRLTWSGEAFGFAKAPFDAD
ncbi:MAG: Fic family protein [Actinomycetota bacterium]